MGYAPKTVPVDAVDCLLQVHKVELELSLPFSALLDDVTQCEDLVYASSTLPEAHLFLPQLLTYCIILPLDDDLHGDLAWDG